MANRQIVLGNVNIDNWAVKFYKELNESFGQRFEIDDLKSELCVVYGRCAEKDPNLDQEAMAKSFTVAARNYLKDLKRKIVNSLKAGERFNVIPYPANHDTDGNGIDIYELKRMYYAKTIGVNGEEYTYSIKDIARRFKVSRQWITKLLKALPRRN